MVNKFQPTHRLRLLIVGVLVGVIISAPLGAYALNTNTKGSMPTSVLADTKSPTVTINSYNTAMTTPDISGTFDDNVKVTKITATVDGHSYVNEVKVDQNSKIWILPSNTLVSPLKPGLAYAVTAEAEDAVGNIGTGSGMIYISAPNPPPVKSDLVD